MKKITIDLIKKYRPCKDGIKNFENKYSKYNDTLENLLMLEDISYSDKVWLATKVLDKMTLVQWSLDCALMVVDNFNKEFPDDNRINETLEVIKQYINGEVDESAAESARSAAESAVSAAESAAWSAMSSAVSAAESAAWSAMSAAESARSAAVSSAGLAAESARLAESAEKQQEDINLSLLIALVSEDV